MEGEPLKGLPSKMIKINAAARLKASEDVIAPSESFKQKNEKELDRQQNQRETEQHKEATSPRSDMSRTAVHDMRSAVKTARRLATS